MLFLVPLVAEHRRNPGEDMISALLHPPAVEELLRFEPPVQMLARIARTDLTLAGTTVPAGGIALLILGSTNRDPARHSDPETFDPRRAPTGHLCFGHGAYDCVGAGLARLEAPRAALRRLLALLGAGGHHHVHVQRDRSRTFRRIAELRIAATAAAPRLAAAFGADRWS
jgi:cytochrome P450